MTAKYNKIFALTIIIISFLLGIINYYKITKPIVAISIRDGLGNQLFMYAFARSYSLKHPYTDIILIKKLKGPHDGYKMDAFNIHNFKVRYLMPEGYEIKHQIVDNTYLYDEDYLKAKNKTIFYHIMQNEKYFKEYEDIIKKELTLKDEPSVQFEESLRLIKSHPVSVSIHVRRGDYLSPYWHKILPSYGNIYYNKAFNLLKTKIGVTPHIFIFSDDIKWVKKNIKLNAPTTYIDHANEKNPYEDIILMSNCTHNIIPNSTFSWWGAWLNANPNKIVIAPKIWIRLNNIKDGGTLNPVPKEWVTIDSKYL